MMVCISLRYIKLNEGGIGRLNNVLVVFSGYNQRAVIAFLRVLQKNQIDKLQVEIEQKYNQETLSIV